MSKCIIVSILILGQGALAKKSHLILHVDSMESSQLSEFKSQGIEIRPFRSPQSSVLPPMAVLKKIFKEIGIKQSDYNWDQFDIDIFVMAALQKTELQLQKLYPQISKEKLSLFQKALRTLSDE